MAFPDPIVIASDPRWFPLRYDPRRDEIQFVLLSRDAHRKEGMLLQLGGDPSLDRCSVRRTALSPVSGGGALHFVLHSGLTGSTLLTQWLDRDGVSMALKEPPIMSDLAGWRANGAAPNAFADVTRLVATLLARPFDTGGAVIVKCSSTGNAVAGDMMGHQPDARALCLHAPLDVFLASIARKNTVGRLWARKLFLGLQGARLVQLGFTAREFFEHTDLQIAADCWLSLHCVMQGTGARFGDRVRSLTSERLIGEPAEALAAVTALFGLERADSAVPPANRHAKSGEQFDAAQRQQELSGALATHRHEIDAVVQWARSVAAAQHIPWDLPEPL